MLETVSLSERERKLGDFGYAGDDHVVPFEVGPLDVRGRVDPARAAARLDP